MLAAVFDLDAGPAPQTTLAAIGRAAGLGPGRTSCAGRATIAMWPGVPSPRLEGDGVAVLGDLTGALRPTASALRARGRFGAIVFDDAGLLLVRSRFGGRPLFYALEARGRRVVVCSRLAPLVAALEGGASLHAARLAELVADTPPRDAGATAYRGVRRVLSAQALAFAPRGDALASEELPLDPIGGPMLLEPPEEIAEELRRRVERSVARCTHGRRRVAVFAGGGVDSSALLATAVARARGARESEVLAVALDVAGEGDDRPYMRELASALGIVPIRVGNARAAPLLGRALVVDGAPVTLPTFAWSAAMTDVARERGADVVLTGTGGDDLFDGDNESFVRRAREGELAGAVLDAARLDIPGASRWNRVEHLVVRPLLRSWLPPRMLAAIRRARGTPVRPGASDAAATLAQAHPLAIAETRAHAELLGGCEHREPLLDDDLLELVVRTPSKHLFHGHRRRGLFRHAFRGVVPDRVRLRRDKMWPHTGLGELLSTPEARRAIDPLVSMRALAARGLVDAGAFRARFDAFVAGGGTDKRGWAELWPALVVEAFVRAFGDGAPAGVAPIAEVGA